MSQVPIQSFLFPVLALAALLFFVVRQKKQLKSYDQQFSNYRAGELAQRLGLTLVQGDPLFNLFIRHANVDVQRGPADNRPIHIEVRAQGSPHGVPLEFSYLYRVEQETGFSQITWRTWFDCRLSAQARQPFPPFEALSRSTPFGPIAQTQSLAPMPTGNPAVDQNYVVATQEPGMAALLGQVLPLFGAFQSSGVHLVGDGRSVAFVMKQDKGPLIASTLYYAETLGKELSELARRVGG
ncbi:MAG TPA: hypothetical protein VMI54_01725 [Polyangiaceae bacterium]|nr:hypothetical protein [Polyangiaceae bacterium]